MKKNLVKIKSKAVVTDSLIVAESFKKQHKDVLKKIRNVIRDDVDNELNFAPVDFKDAKGETREKYIMDRRSFSILCMSFTGKRALKWKNRFYDAFEAMEKALVQQICQKNNSNWIEHRNSGKMVRRDTTDTIKEFIEYAISQGSVNAHKYYMIISKMENSAMFLLERKFKNLRDVLNVGQLSLLNTAEGIIIKALKEGMDKGMYYKDIYQLAKERVCLLAELHGKTFIPASQLPRGQAEQLELF